VKEPHAPSVEPALSFDRFQILTRRRLLVEAGKPVRIGSRAFDILVALVERPGERIGKAELLARVWPDTHVVDGNLKFQVAALRRVLRDGRDGRRFIDTSQGQGYCFVAPVSVSEEGDQLPAPVGVARRHNLPEQLTPLIGRDDVVAKLAEQVTMHRLVAIVGPGGIGKTSVALAVAERVVEAHADGVWMVDLSRIAHPGLVRGAVAGAVGVSVSPGLTTEDLVATLRGRRMLLVLDNCVHVVDAAAALVCAILRGAPHIRILATSREPLRTEGEHLCRLGPLETPPPSRQIGAAEALRYASVQLFVEQAGASLDGFHLTDGDAPLVAEICRKLDGIPLAIQLAAAQFDVLGLNGLAARLDDRLRLLTGGRRTALSRHRTMRAALDWSYDLLSPPEQTIFCRLAVFVDGFTLAAAASVVADESDRGDEVVRLVLELATKSLVVAAVGSPGPRFRLLDTTRAYALEKVLEKGLAALVHRHATYFVELLEAARLEHARGEEQYGAVELDVGNLRAALEWAFGPEGDLTIGVRLAAASLPLWFSMSLLGEAHGWTERAIQNLDKAGLLGSRQEMLLQAALGISLQMVKAGTSEANAALSRALTLAEQLRDADFQLHVLHSLWVYHMRIGEVRTALDLARRGETMALSVVDPDATTTAEWMLGIALHFSGQYRSARLHLEHLLRNWPPGSRDRQILSAGFDQHTAARYILGHVLWVQGYPDQATQAVRIAMEDARRMEHPVTLCSVLAWGACALALRVGDLDEAWRSATELVERAEKHALADHLSYGLAALEIISLRKVGSNAGVEQVRMAFARWRASKWHVLLSVGDFAEAAAAVGLVGETSSIVDDALRRAEGNQELWAYPEMLRVKGELLLLQENPGPSGARRYFVRSLERARARGALAWQLRSAVSLHRLDLRDGDASESRELLSHVYKQFGEGFDTADLQAAEQLLAAHREWRRSGADNPTSPGISRPESTLGVRHRAGKIPR
jgi:predicted ATPase/DNA-binding winged helix-turn-helix (wHTH) protein